MSEDIGANAEMFVIPKCGHWPHVNYPKKISQLIEKFVAKAEKENPRPMTPPPISEEEK